MALRQLLIGKKISDLRAQLDELMRKRDGLTARRAEMQRREEELEASLGEMTEDTSAEDREAFDGLTQEWEADDATLTEEEKENKENAEGLERQIGELEKELSELNKRAIAAASGTRSAEGNTRKDETKMNTRKFFGMTHQERDAFFAHDDVKRFLGCVRTVIREKRAVTGTDAIIPTIVLDLVRERITEYSKLIKHVNLQRASGDARISIMGVVPEAVWTEMCANSNEIDLSFGMVTLDGYMVSAFVPVCNAVLEDNDVDLATKVIEAIGKSMGRAIDKAILFGRGDDMPTGILTALLAGEYAETNVVAVNGNGIDLFKAILGATGEINNDYSDGEKFWVMNEKTKTKLMIEAMGFSAAGAIVTGQNDEMPIIGGKIETIGDVPDDMIIGGYGDLYTLLERAAMSFEKSEHARFTQNQTVFKGNARYDGRPVIEKGFVAMGIGGVKPTAAGITFAEDKANAA